MLLTNDLKNHENVKTEQELYTPLYGHQVPCSHLAVLKLFAEQHGVDMTKLLLKHHLSAESIMEPGATITAVQYTQLLLSVDNQLEQDEFWFDFANQLDFPSYDILGQVLLSCVTLRQAINMLAKYYQLFSCGSELVSIERQDGIHLLVNRQESIESRTSLIRSELLTSLIYNGVSKTLPDKGAKLRFEFDYREPSYAHLYRSRLNKNCYFSAEQSKIFIPSEYLDNPGVHPNATMLKILTNQCDQMLSTLDSVLTLGVKVRNIISAVPRYYPSAQETAQKIGISVRTMNRKLKAQGLTFQTILDHVKLQQAINYLQTNEKSIEEVTTLMGYSDSANFRRAFVRWTGVLPSKYRPNLTSYKNLGNKQLLLKRGY